PDLLPHQPPDLPGDLGRRAEQVHRPADVEERLVDGDLFDVGGEAFEDLHHLRGILEIAFEGAGDDPQLWAEATGLGGGHRRADAEGPRLVAGGEDHPGSHRHGNPAERRVEELLYRGIERIQVGVEYVSLTHATHHGRDVGHRWEVCLPGHEANLRGQVGWRV